MAGRRRLWYRLLHFLFRNRNCWLSVRMYSMPRPGQMRRPLKRHSVVLSTILHVLRQWQRQQGDPGDTCLPHGNFYRRVQHGWVVGRAICRGHALLQQLQQHEQQPGQKPPCRAATSSMHARAADADACHQLESWLWSHRHSCCTAAVWVGDVVCRWRQKPVPQPTSAVSGHEARHTV